MLCVLVNEDVTNLEFGKNLKEKIYRDKPIESFLFFDLPSVLVHYIMALDSAPEGNLQCDQMWQFSANWAFFGEPWAFFSFDLFAVG